MASSIVVANEIMTIGRVATRVLSVRAHFDSSPPGKHPVCFVIPGNPGSAAFYHSYLQHLGERCRGSMDIFSVSHAGQDPGVRKSDVLSGGDAGTRTEMCGQAGVGERYAEYDGGDMEYFTVEDQVRHHTMAVRELTSPGQPIILMGHSMGSHLIIRMCRQPEVEQRVVRTVHLLPCPAWMGSSPRGVGMAPFLTKYQSLFRVAQTALTYLPECLVRGAVSLHLSGVAAEVREYCLNIVMYSVCGENGDVIVGNIAALGGNEVLTILDFDFDTIRTICSRSCFLCSRTDGWFPMKRVDELRTEIPDLDVKLLDDIHHDFVLHENAEVADMAWDLIKHVL